MSDYLGFEHGARRFQTYLGQWEVGSTEEADGSVLHRLLDKAGVEEPDDWQPLLYPFSKVVFVEKSDRIRAQVVSMDGNARQAFVAWAEKEHPGKQVEWQLMFDPSAPSS